MDLLKLGMAVQDLEDNQKKLEVKFMGMMQNLKILMSNTRKAYAYAEALRRILVSKKIITDEESVKQFEAEVKVLLEREQYEMDKQKKKLQVVKNQLIKSGGVIINPQGG